MIKQITHTILAAISLGFFAAQANALSIDLIDPGTPTYPDQYNLLVSTSNPIASVAVAGLNPASTIGGRRDVGLNVNGGTNAQSLKLYGNTFLDFLNDTNTSGVLTLSYGVGADLNANLLSDGSNAFAISVVAIGTGPNHLGLGSGLFSLTLRSNATTGSSTINVPFTTTGIYFFSFSDPGFSGLNFADIDAITLTLKATTPGTDFRIDSISTAVVPEPSAGILMSIGGTGLALLLIRRKRAAV